MKLILAVVVVIFIIKAIVAKSDEKSLASHDSQRGEINVNTALAHNSRPFLNKPKKFVVALSKPKTSFSLPKRDMKKNRFSKFEIQHNVQKGNTFHAPSTRRPHLMQAKRFTSKPHAIDHAKKLLQISNFNNKRNQNKFNQYGAEEKDTTTKKNDYKTKHSEHFENRFQNFTDISNENDSDESKEIKKPIRRGYMKTAASNKVKAIASPPSTRVNTQRNYKIKDLLKNHKYTPRAERKMVPVLALQKSNSTIIRGRNNTSASEKSFVAGLSSDIEGSSTKKDDVSVEETADRNEFIFVKEDKHKTGTTSSPESDEIVTSDPLIIII